MLNHIAIMGRLTRTPELRRTKSGKPVCTITLAVERDRKDADGEKSADFFDVVAWNKLAEFVAKYLAKGRAVVAEGRMESRPWTDDKGNKRTSWELKAEKIYFADAKHNDGDGEPQGYAEGEEAEEE